MEINRLQEVPIPGTDLQASDWSQSDSPSGPENPSDIGDNKSNNDDDDPSGASVNDHFAIAQAFIKFNCVMEEPQF